MKNLFSYLEANKVRIFFALTLVVGVAFGLMPHESIAAAPFLFMGTTDTITAAFVQQWDNAIRAQAQQMTSRLGSAVVDRGAISGDGFTINTVGSVELDANTVRHGDTNWGDAGHANRLAVMQDFYKALPLDRNDIPKMLVNPVTGGDYMKLLMAARARKMDSLIYNALRGTITSKDGVTSNVLPSTQKIAHGSAGLTKAKIIQAKSIFRANEADEFNGEELFFAYNSKALEDIMSDTNLTSADWMAVQMLQSGAVATKWMGFTWIPYEPIELTSSTYYTVAWAKSGIHFGRGYEEGNVTRRGDKKDLWQVSMGASYGAGRQDELKIVEVAFQ